MSDEERMVEAAITRALERQPEVVVPVDFAAKVRAALPAQPKVRARRSVGQIGGGGWRRWGCCWRCAGWLRMRGPALRAWRSIWRWCWWWSWRVWRRGWGRGGRMGEWFTSRK